MTSHPVNGAREPTCPRFDPSSPALFLLMDVAGGHDENKNALRAAEAYDVEEEK